MGPAGHAAGVPKPPARQRMTVEVTVDREMRWRVRFRRATDVRVAGCPRAGLGHSEEV